MNLIVACQNQKLVVLKLRGLTGNPLIGGGRNEKDIVTVIDHCAAETDEIIVVGKRTQRSFFQLGIRFAITVDLHILQRNMMRFSQFSGSRCDFIALGGSQFLTERVGQIVGIGFRKRVFLTEEQGRAAAHCH